jgi:protocatechuate 3,4-dioxygenase, beta subunit
MRNIFAAFMIFHAVIAYAQKQQDRAVGGACENCNLLFESMPGSLSSRTTVTSVDEPGEPLEISGIIYKADEKTPAEGVILYIYHTDAKGEYSQLPGVAQQNPHGRLRGWMKTDSRGQYFFRTIRPASYPNSRAPQHIHPLIKESGLVPYWIDEYVFEDDPFVGTAYRNNQRYRGGSGIIRLTQDDRGIWVGRRDIILGKNIPDYQSQARQ